MAVARQLAKVLPVHLRALVAGPGSLEAQAGVQEPRN